MATFEETQDMTMQEHFEVLEIDLPVITGTCTIDGNPGFGTPLTCDQSWEGEYKTYKFTTGNAPLLPGSPWRLIKSITESATELKPGEGLSARGSLSITFTDEEAQDPNPTAPGVTREVKERGSFFGKLAARQIFEDKKVRLRLYRVQPDGSIDLVNGSQDRHYVASSFMAGSNGSWVLKCKDALSLTNLDKKTWPVASKGRLRQDIDNAVTAIPVDTDADYSSASVVRIGKEHLKVTSVTGNLTPQAVLNVAARGSTIVGAVSGKVLTKTVSAAHSGGDEVFICEVSDNETIDSLLARILVDSDLDESLIPKAEWAEEVNEWHANDKINTIHSTSEDVNDIIQRILTGFLMDLWFSTTENKVKLSAISVWKETSSVINEGCEIKANSITKKAQESLRASRAFVVYDKDNIADSDDTSSYNRASQFSAGLLTSEQFFGKHKDKAFKNNNLIDTEAADLLVQRYVSRFKFMPYLRTFTTSEQFLTFKTGDIVDIRTTIDQAPDGSTLNNIRSQIIKVNPIYTGSGREYKVSALTYEEAFNGDAEIVLDTPLSEANLYTLAGAPSLPVTLTFILTAHSFGRTGFKAGSFAAGSKIIIILVDGFNGQASGGTGGNGQNIRYVQGLWLADGGNLAGEDGGIVYDAQGVDTDIYLSGPTPSASHSRADGYIRAPGGGGNGGLSNSVGEVNQTGYAGNGGGGGAGNAGNIGGIAGLGGTVTPSHEGVVGDDGGSGTTTGIGGPGGDSPQNPRAGIGGNWGKDSNDGGLAGSGIINNGATVVLYGATPARYINGRGNHPITY